MKRIRALYNDKYLLSTVIISMAVAVLIHFPESVSLFDGFESHTLFPGMKFADVANEIIFTFLSLLALFAVNTRLFHFNQTSMKITWQKIVLSFVLTWILSNLLGQCFVYLHKTFDIPAIDAMVHHYLHPLRDFIMSCLVTSSCYIIYLIRRQQQVIIENEQLQAENIRNQFEVLKNQLNPHMLFNSLNTLRSLVRENQDRAAYIFLLKMRFEDNLQFEIDIECNLEDYFLPPMSIQMLIENAVKHNEISNRRPLTITIVTDPEGSLSVSNPIQPKLTAATGTGIGLANLDKRYHLLFRQEIQITEDSNFTVRIPLIRKYP